MSSRILRITGYQEDLEIAVKTENLTGVFVEVLSGADLLEIVRGAAEKRFGAKPIYRRCELVEIGTEMDKPSMEVTAADIDDYLKGIKCQPKSGK